MFRRCWIWFGKLISDEGFSLAYGNRSITYSDERGSYQFGFEDGFLSPRPLQVEGEPGTDAGEKRPEMFRLHSLRSTWQEDRDR